MSAKTKKFLITIFCVIVGVPLLRRASWLPYPTSAQSFQGLTNGGISVAVRFTDSEHEAWQFIITDALGRENTFRPTPGIQPPGHMAVSSDGSFLAYSSSLCSCCDAHHKTNCSRSAFMQKMGQKPVCLPENLFWQSAVFSRDNKSLVLRTFSGFVALDVASLRQKWRWNTSLPHNGYSAFETGIEGFCIDGTHFARVKDGVVYSYNLRLRHIQVLKLPAISPSDRRVDTRLSPQGNYVCRLVQGEGSHQGRAFVCVQSAFKRGAVWQHGIDSLSWNPYENANSWPVFYSRDESVCAIKTDTCIEVFETASGKHLRWLSLAPGHFEVAQFSRDASKIYTQTDFDTWAQKAR